MYSSTILSAVILAGICLAEPPIQKPTPSTAWLWAEAMEQVCDETTCYSTAWLWAEAANGATKDSLPVGCHCGPDCKCGHGADCKCTQQECYEKLRLQAIREKKPLSVGVGCEPVHVDGVLSCRYDKYPGVKSGIVVGFVVGNELVAYDPLPCAATVEQIKAAARFKNNVKVESLAGNH